MGIINMFKSALLIASVSAIQLEGKPVQKKTKDIACHIGEGANGVGQSVCDIVKEAVDVKPWPRTGPAPAHDQYYKGNTGDLPANPDGTLKKVEEEAPAKEEKKEEKKDAKKAEAKEGEKKEEAKEEKKEEAKAEEKKEEAPKEEKKEEAKAEEKKEEAAPAKEEAKK